MPPQKISRRQANETHIRLFVGYTCIAHASHEDKEEYLFLPQKFQLTVNPAVMCSKMSQLGQFALMMREIARDRSPR
jgi:hypothetical protein